MPTHKTLALVHRYFTPFALTLTAAALFVSRPAGVYATVCFLVLGFSAVFNWATERWARKVEHFVPIREGRLGVNLAVNCFLVYLLLTLWRPIWLLFTLTPVATAVYEDRGKTGQMAVGLAVLLLWAYWLNGLRTQADLAEAGAHALFIVFLSLFVNAVAGPGAPTRAITGRL